MIFYIKNVEFSYYLWYYRKKTIFNIIISYYCYIIQYLKDQISQGNDIELINNLGGSALEMLSVFIPCIFKLKGKSKISTRKCTKANFKDYSILS